jgi:hypothetical protein
MEKIESELSSYITCKIVGVIVIHEKYHSKLYIEGSIF